MKKREIVEGGLGNAAFRKDAEAAVERAIELSRTTYCSVSNSLRPDIEFKTTYFALADWLARRHPELEAGAPEMFRH